MGRVKRDSMAWDKRRLLEMCVKNEIGLNKMRWDRLEQD